MLGNWLDAGGKIGSRSPVSSNDHRITLSLAPSLSEAQVDRFLDLGSRAITLLERQADLEVRIFERRVQREADRLQREAERAEVTDIEDETPPHYLGHRLDSLIDLVEQLLLRITPAEASTSTRSPAEASTSTRSPAEASTSTRSPAEASTLAAEASTSTSSPAKASSKPQGLVDERGNPV